jgi:hypothetical protein
MKKLALLLSLVAFATPAFASTLSDSELDTVTAGYKAPNVQANIAVVANVAVGSAHVYQNAVVSQGNYNYGYGYGYGGSVQKNIGVVVNKAIYSYNVNQFAMLLQENVKH